MRPVALAALALWGLACAGPPRPPPESAHPVAARSAPAAEPVPPGEPGAPALVPAAPAPLAAGAASAGGPSLSLEPARARPGDAFAVTVRGVTEAPRGELGGRPLRFYPVAGGFRALAGLPVETSPGTLELALTAAGPDGETVLAAGLEVTEPGFAETELRVAQRFITPSPEAKLRMRRDQAAFRRAFDQPFEPPLVRDPFAWPREAELTGRFGDRRVFNGKKVSQHHGLDVAGATGDPVGAANDGLVVLVRDCYASGKSVVLWHGAGLYSVYFHLSRFAVKEGARVRRGDLLGLVGKTGRVTGPHLHWGTKLDDSYVDPESVLRLAAGDGAPARPAAAP
ncbi:MAG TPA: M23 family metallopeptidase [Anaeromyxobacteraceae bacterium]|nr:M23 family metallopeptidase [Anaeromyxobacteraceae bacterium]